MNYKQPFLLSFSLLLCIMTQAQINVGNSLEIEKYKTALLQKDIARKRAIEEYVNTNHVLREYYDTKGNFVFLHHIDFQ